MAVRLTQFARGGGCACKIPPGELEDAVARLLPERKPADLLIGAPDPGSPDLLRRYQRQRRPDNLLMLAATDALDRLFSNDHPLLRLARDVGIAAVHRTPPLKRLFMRQAMGAPLSSGGAHGGHERLDVTP